MNTITDHDVRHRERFLNPSTQMCEGVFIVPPWDKRSHTSSIFVSGTIYDRAQSIESLRDYLVVLSVVSCHFLAMRHPDLRATNKQMSPKRIYCSSFNPYFLESTLRLLIQVLYKTSLAATVSTYIPVA